MSPAGLLFHGDWVSATVAWTLLLMSVVSWVVILWKAWLLHRGVRDVARSTAAFWQAPDWASAVRAVPVFDRENLVMPLVQATLWDARGTLAGAADRAPRLTRLLRDALQAVLHRLQSGQVVLATVGATAPFVGLLGTVWGIYHALMGIAGQGQVSLDQVAGPVGEALVMTAAGLGVAIPAVLGYNVLGYNVLGYNVLGYNVLGRAIGRIEAALEGFAFDLREFLSDTGAGARQDLG